jgi:hypothetical protein
MAPVVTQADIPSDVLSEPLPRMTDVKKNGRTALADRIGGSAISSAMSSPLELGAERRRASEARKQDRPGRSAGPHARPTDA